jgi:hypothetical protein
MLDSKSVTLLQTTTSERENKSLFLPSSSISSFMMLSVKCKSRKYKNSEQQVFISPHSLLLSMLQHQYC